MQNNQLQNIADILHEMDKKAALHLSNHNYTEALSVYKEVLRAQEQLKLEKLLGHTLLNMANIYMIQNNYNDALDAINRAASMKSIQTNNDDRGNLKICHANCLFNLNRAPEAETELKNELRKNFNKTLCGKMELLLFSYYKDSNNKSAARMFADKAINHFKLDRNTNELLRALYGRADYFRKIGQDQYARYDEIEIERLINN